jgi:hypothetical protein
LGFRCHSVQFMRKLIQVFGSVWEFKTPSFSPSSTLPRPRIKTNRPEVVAMAVGAAMVAAKVEVVSLAGKVDVSSSEAAFTEFNHASVGDAITVTRRFAVANPGLSG